MSRRTDDYAQQAIEDTLTSLHADAERGLSDGEAAKRLAQYGYNEIREKEEPLWHRIFRRFWGPIPWMIETAAVLSAMVRKWDDFSIIAILLLVNASLDFFQEHRALNALKALKQRMTAEIIVLHDGEFKTIPSRELVPGDIVKLLIDNIVPADVQLLQGDYLLIVFLFDVDNTLLDNDRVEMDLRLHLESEFGTESKNRYFTILEELRTEIGYTDYLGALQRYRLEKQCDHRLLLMSSFLVDYPFADRLYPKSLDVLKHVQAWGPKVILSDGDVVFQPRKVQRSGLWNAVEGRVLIYVHKERMLPDIEGLYPARHYVMVDDKLRILSAMRTSWGDRLTAVFPRQGHYALDQRNVDAYPRAQVTVERIGDLVHYDLASFLGAAGKR